LGSIQFISKQCEHATSQFLANIYSLKDEADETGYFQLLSLRASVDRIVNLIPKKHEGEVDVDIDAKGKIKKPRGTS